MGIVTAIGAAASIGGALLSSKSNNKAANTAAAQAQQAANQNNALQQSIYNQNAGALAPFQRRGNQAGDMRNALLGMPNTSSLPDTYQMGGYGTPIMGGFNGGGFNSGFGGMMYGEPQPFMDQAQGGFGYMGIMPGMEQPHSGAAQGANQVNQAQNAFDTFRGSTGYQFRVNEGNRALDAGFASRGLGESGAAMKSAMRFGQNIASDEFARYMGYLGEQQGTGLAAASAQAGVGQGFANAVSQNNDSAATAAANAALLRGQNNANLYGAVGNTLGQFVGSSFRR